MDIFELNRLNEIKKYISEVKDLIEIENEKKKNEVINDVLDIIQEEINFQSRINGRFDVALQMEKLYDKILNELFYKGDL